ncbi:MAG: TerB family tellurite resistance protein [Desulfobacterales bacterium]
MIDTLKRFFGKSSTDPSRASGRQSDHDIRVATCALLVEIARIDEAFTPSEMETLLCILKEKYGLSEENADALIIEAEKELANSLDLWQFAKLINQNYSNEEKIEIIETLWRIVYVDGKMNAHERYMMNKVKNLLRISHDQLIAAKLKVRDS